MNEYLEQDANPKDIQRKRILEDIKAELVKVRNYTPKVGVFGDSGVGKSSLCNALFGSEIAKISHTSACTREAQEILIGSESSGGIKLLDVPGVGETPERHEEYLDLYKSLTTDLDLILWAIKSVDRNNMASIDAFKRIILPSKCPVVFVVTQADLINPHRDWDIDNNKPGKNQQANLNEKVIEVSRIFEISTDRIVVVSATDNYNLSKLVSTMVKVLPNEKKYSFTREAKEENVSEEARVEAEEGIFDYIKEKAGEAWDFIKDDVLEVAKDVVTEYAPKIAKAAIKWFKKWF